MSEDVFVYDKVNDCFGILEVGRSHTKLRQTWMGRPWTILMNERSMVRDLAVEMGNWYE